MDWSLEVNQEKVNGSISQLEDICERISQKRTELSAIEDGTFSEGEFYKEYCNTAEELYTAMETVEQAIRGYINILRYSSVNYETVNSEMASAMTGK